MTFYISYLLLPSSPKTQGLDTTHISNITGPSDQKSRWAELGPLLRGDSVAEPLVSQCCVPLGDICVHPNGARWLNPVPHDGGSSLSSWRPAGGDHLPKKLLYVFSSFPQASPATSPLCCESLLLQPENVLDF